MVGSTFIRSDDTFSGRQQIREQYQEMAETLRGVVHLVHERMQPAVKRYLNHVSDVISRGATANDVAEFNAKIDEWTQTEKALMAAANAPGQPVSIAISPTVTTRKQALVDTDGISDTAAQYLDKLRDVNPLLLVGVAVGLILLFKR